MMQLTQPAAARRQRGAALVIGLIMLLILTILAFTGLNSATTELAMASNDQFRHNATQAASAGIEQAISNLRNVSTVTGAPPTVVPLTALPGSPDDRYTTRTRFVGEETGLPQSSADKFVGLHYTIESDGVSARNANDAQIQGVMVVASAGTAGGAPIGQVGTGLE
jgi:Tfp pilus assembly protein PilX